MEVGELSIVHCQLSIDSLFQVVDFFFQEGDAVGEVVVFPDFPGQLFDLGVGDGLGYGLGFFLLICGDGAGGDDADGARLRHGARYGRGRPQSFADGSRR